MNKKPRTLQLSRETLRNLDPEDSKEVVGGLTTRCNTEAPCDATVPVSQCYGTCRCV